MDSTEDDRFPRDPGEPDGRRGRPDRDYDREPPRSSNRPVWILLAAGGCGVFLVCSGLIALAVIWAARSFTTDFPAAQAAADQFLDLLKQGKIADAYALTSPQFQKEQSREQFDAFVKQHETFTRQTSRTMNGFRLFQDGGGKRVFIQMTLNSPNNAMTCTLIMVEEAGEWKVEKITVP